MWRILTTIFWMIISNMADCERSLNLLLMGGNGFIGGHVAESLLDAGHRLTIVTRSGKWRWDAENELKPRIHNHVVCDRRRPQDCDESVWKAFSQQYDAVVDFSAFRTSDVRPFYQKLLESNSKNLLYIYISTDSVYEVCLTPAGVLLKETDAVRPDDPQESEKFARKDSYGHKKLQVEEYLIEQRRNKQGFPYAILRLPDVLGERDSTDRWWKYLLWLRYERQLEVAVPIPSFCKDLRTSYVDVRDIGPVIVSILSAGETAHDQIYNVGYPEPKLLSELIAEMRKACQSTELSDIETPEENVFFFPSVTKGGLNVSKLSTEFKWRPKYNWTDMIERISRFYLEAERRYPQQRDEILQSLVEDLNLNENQRQRLFASVADSSAPKRKFTDEF